MPNTPTAHGPSIQYIYIMATKLTLNQAVSKIYGRTLTPTSDPIHEWHFFMPFSKPLTHDTLLMTLLEVPAHLITSEEICNRAKTKFGQLLLPVKLIFVERCFHSSFYLLVGQHNLTPLSSIMRIRQEAGEKVDESLIIDYISFASRLLAHPHSADIHFDQHTIALDSQGRYVLANPLMFFQSHQANQEQSQPCLSQNAHQVLAKMIANGQPVNWPLFPQIVREKYGPKILELVQHFLQPRASTEVESLITEMRRSAVEESFSATITDTCVEERLEDTLMNTTANSHFVDGNLHKAKQQSSRKTKKILGLIVLFIVVFIGIGAVTFAYLKPRPLECESDQYADETENRCIGCSQRCESCTGSGETMCSSCKTSLFLILHNQHDKAGRCEQVCHGTIIKTTICIDNH